MGLYYARETHILTVAIAEGSLSISLVISVFTLIHGAVAVTHFPMAILHRIDEPSHVYISILISVSAATLNHSSMPKGNALQLDGILVVAWMNHVRLPLSLILTAGLRAEFALTVPLPTVEVAFVHVTVGVSIHTVTAA